MPILSPGGNGYKPKDWRYPYDALIAFKKAVSTVSTRIGKRIPTDHWHIIHPGRFQGMADPRWQLVYDNVNGHQETIYIGSDALTARNTIKKVHNQYIEVLLVRAKNPASTDPRVLQSKNDPRYVPHVVERMREVWNEMRKARSVKEWDDAMKANPNVVKFMKSKAGYLPMTMEEYLYRHPMSHRWPTPPTSEKQLKDRLRQDEDYERQTEKARQLQEQNYQADNGPGWQGL